MQSLEKECRKARLGACDVTVISLGPWRKTWYGNRLPRKMTYDMTFNSLQRWVTVQYPTYNTNLACGIWGSCRGLPQPAPSPRPPTSSAWTWWRHTPGLPPGSTTCYTDGRKGGTLPAIAQFHNTKHHRQWLGVTTRCQLIHLAETRSYVTECSSLTRTRSTVTWLAYDNALLLAVGTGT